MKFVNFEAEANHLRRYGASRRLGSNRFAIGIRTTALNHSNELNI